MRPIDADAINPMRCPQSIAEMQKWIDSMPTVEAIPLTWLREFGRSIHECGLEDDAALISFMIMMWRTEQEVERRRR